MRTLLGIKLRFRFLLIAISLLIVSVVALGKSFDDAAQSQSENGPSSKAELRLTTSILSRRYCVGDGEVSVMQLHVRLHYTNSGCNTIILYKGSTTVAYEKLSRTKPDGKEEPETRPVFYNIESRGRPFTRLDNQFAVLQPGTSFNTVTDLPIFFSIGKKIFSGSVSTGAHLLRVGIETWPESQDDPLTFRQRWADTGYLWNDGIVSEPMKFAIDINPKLKKCD